MPSAERVSARARATPCMYAPQPPRPGADHLDASPPLTTVHVDRKPLSQLPCPLLQQLAQQRCHPLLCATLLAVLRAAAARATCSARSSMPHCTRARAPPTCPAPRAPPVLRPQVPPGTGGGQAARSGTCHSDGAPERRGRGWAWVVRHMHERACGQAQNKPGSKHQYRTHLLEEHVVGEALQVHQVQACAMLQSSSTGASAVVGALAPKGRSECRRGCAAASLHT